jgi:predicted transcriptional regulator
MLTEKQMEIINGSLLGDGCIWNNFVDPMCKFQLGQSKLDKDGIDKKTYILWFAFEFIELGITLRLKKKKGTGLANPNKIYENYLLTTRSHLFWTELEKKWYIPIEHKYFKRKKIVPRDLILTPLILCVWMMEDGSNYTKDGNITLETQGFYKEDVDFLIERLNKDLSIKATKKKNTTGDNQWRIFIGVESFRHIVDLIKPYVAWDCFQYKLDSNYQKIHQAGEHHSQSKITEKDAKSIIGLRKAGISVKDIAKKFNLTSGAISQITSGARWSHLNENCDIKKKPRITKEQKQKIIDLCHLEQKDIAKLVGVNQSTVSRILNK